MTNLRVSYPLRYRRDAAAAKLVTRLMTPRANTYLVTSFFTAPVWRQNTFLVPPILRQEVLRAKPSEREHVLIYVTSPSADLVKLVAQVRCPFIAYGFGRDGKDGNILFKKPDTATFLEDLASAKAIIANAGFSLVSEALYLGKPYLAVPVKQQFEQIFNAHYLAQTGYGAYWEDLSKEKIESFLFSLPHYREELVRYPRQDNSALFQKLDSLIADYTSRSAAGARA